MSFNEHTTITVWCFAFFMFCIISHHLSPLLCWACFSQGEDVAADWDLPPDARFGVLGEAVSRVHHQHAVCGQPIHLTIRCLPLSSFLLENTKAWLHVSRMGTIQISFCNPEPIDDLGPGTLSMHSTPNVWTRHLNIKGVERKENLAVCWYQNDKLRTMVCASDT